VEEIRDQLQAIPELEGGFDAVGFSQGGQILRAFVQRFNAPPVRNLITVGAQHQGVSNFPGCREDVGNDKQVMPKQDCSWWQRMMENSVYSTWVQSHFVQAQYFKDPFRMKEYLRQSIFLADVNNEREEKNELYRDNLASLSNFVMYMFQEDTQIVPKESSVLRWFALSIEPL